METLNLLLHVWRQEGPNSAGRFETYEAKNISQHASFLEMLDIVNQDIQSQGKDPIAFDSDCREGICGSCGMMINGVAHGPMPETTTCQLHMRHFKDVKEVTIEPWRASSFPLVKDLVVDRSAFDRLIAAGGYIAVRTGSPQDANNILVPKQHSDVAMDAAACIGCGACVAACPNASANLFTSAKIGHLNILPQGQPEAGDRVRKMVAQMDAEGFGHCSNHFECEAVCPKGISTEFIARMNRSFLKEMALSEDSIPNPQQEKKT